LKIGFYVFGYLDVVRSKTNFVCVYIYSIFVSERYEKYLSLHRPDWHNIFATT